MQLLGMLMPIMAMVACLGAFAVGWPMPRSEIAVKTLMDIPQSHCLRYFKHDIHLMRRCRNHRVPMLRKPNKK